MTDIKKDSSIMYIRCISMVMIICCHYCQYFGNTLAWWLNVGVQIFLTISGYLYGKKTIPDIVSFIHSRAKKILIPYYLFLIPVTVLYFIFSKETLSVSSIVQSFFLVGTIKGVGHLWFVGYIMACYFIVPYLQSMRQQFMKYSPLNEVLSWICAVILFQFVVILTGGFFRIDRISCFVIGYIISCTEERMSPKKVNLCQVILLVLATVASILRLILEYRILIESNHLSLYINYTQFVLGITLFWWMHRLFAKIPLIPAVAKLDKYTYYVFLVHQLFILSPFSLMQLTNSVIINITISLIAIFFFGYVLQRCSELLIKKSEVKV